MQVACFDFDPSVAKRRAIAFALVVLCILTAACLESTPLNARNESRVEFFKYATPELDAIVNADIGKLSDWMSQTSQFHFLIEDPGGHPMSRHNFEFACHAAWWRSVSEYPTVSPERPTAAAEVGFTRCLAFPTLDSAPNPSALNAVVSALEARGRGAPLMHTVDAAKLPPPVFNPPVRPAAPPVTPTRPRGSFGP
jgi:hypothetical protein